MGFDVFLTKYQLYFFRFIIPLIFKSLVALLNISKDTGSVFSSFGICFGPSSTWMDLSIALVEGIEAATWNHGTSTGGRIRSSSAVCGRVETAVGIIIVLFLFLEDASSDNRGQQRVQYGYFII